MSEKPKMDLSQFNLDYERKSDKQQVKVQRLVDGDYMVYDPVAEEVTRFTRKRFRNRFTVLKKSSPQRAA